MSNKDPNNFSTVFLAFLAGYKARGTFLMPGEVQPISSRQAEKLFQQRLQANEGVTPRVVQAADDYQEVDGTAKVFAFGRHWRRHQRWVDKGLGTQDVWYVSAT